MASADLSAALIGWYLAALTPGGGSLEPARFTLASALAVARLPWLWHGGGQEEVEKELAVLLAHTTDARLDREERIRWAEAEWMRLTQGGRALRCLEAVIHGMSLEVLRARIVIDELLPGDVLWQGKAGFCVVLRRCSRSARENVPVLKLQDKAAESAFAASSTVPLRALLDEAVIPRTPDFGDESGGVLRASSLVNSRRTSYGVRDRCRIPTKQAAEPGWASAPLALRGVEWDDQSIGQLQDRQSSIAELCGRALLAARLD